MNNEGTKTRRSLLRWIRITGAAQTVLFLLLISPFVWALVSVLTTPRVPKAVKDARQLAATMRPHVDSGALAEFLINSEEAIRDGKLTPLNCVPPWFFSVQKPGPLSDTVAEFDGTNLCISAVCLTKAVAIKVKLSLESGRHPKNDATNHVIMVSPNCSLAIAESGK